MSEALFPAALRLLRAFTGSLFLDFHPSHVPALVFDGERTWFSGATPTEPGWEVHEGFFVWKGCYPSLNAHTAVQLQNGVWAAGIYGVSDFRSAAQLASILAHEAFHVWQKQHQAVFSASELDAVTYPRLNADVLHSRGEETRELALALSSSAWEVHARNALAWRRVRYGLLSAEHVLFERRMELLEGLAHLVETAFRRELPELDAVQATELSARAWAYRSGAALSHLLERTGTQWQKAVLNGEYLDDLLDCALPADPPRLPVTEELRMAALNAVRRHEQHVSEAQKAFETQSGRRLRLCFAAPPAHVSFDPMSILSLSDGVFLHQRFLSVESAGVKVKVMGGPVLTRGNSPWEPLELHLTGLPELVWSSGTMSVNNDVYTIEFPLNVPPVVLASDLLTFCLP